LFGLGDRHINHINSKSLVGISPCSFRACKKIQNTILYTPENKPEPQKDRIVSNGSTSKPLRLEDYGAQLLALSEDLRSWIGWMISAFWKGEPIWNPQMFGRDAHTDLSFAF